MLLSLEEKCGKQVVPGATKQPDKPCSKHQMKCYWWNTGWRDRSTSSAGFLKAIWHKGSGKQRNFPSFNVNSPCVGTDPSVPSSGYRSCHQKKQTPAIAHTLTAWPWPCEGLFYMPDRGVIYRSFGWYKSDLFFLFLQFRSLFFHGKAGVSPFYWRERGYYLKKKKTTKKQPGYAVFLIVSEQIGFCNRSFLPGSLKDDAQCLCVPKAFLLSMKWP